MKKVVITIVLLLGFMLSVNAQSSLNDYKYVVIPEKFDFLKSSDQYQLNSLTQFLFKKYGFNALLGNESYPDDLVRNRCLALTSDVQEVNGLFKTKLFVVLKNCEKEVIYKTRVGETKEKNFTKAYQLAIRSAFKSFETVNYSYKPSDKTVSLNKDKAENSVEVGKLKAEIEELKKTQKGAQITSEKGPEILAITINESEDLLYAQPIEAGFQVVDNTPKVVMILLETPLEKTFIVKNENAIIYWQDGLWYLSKNDGQKLSVEVLNIKF